MSNKTKAVRQDEVSAHGLKPKLRFPEYRNSPEWEPNSLGSKTSKIGSGVTPTGGDKTYKNEGRPFIRSQNIGWGYLILDDVAFIDDATHSTFPATEIMEGDVFLNITGASIGRSAVADSRVKGGNVNQHVCIIRAKPLELTPYFLNQYLLSEEGQRQIDSFQAGGNRQGLNYGQVRSFSLSLPAIEEQQKIADCLSSIDELITVQSPKLDTLKAHKKGLMQQLFPLDSETMPKLRFPEFKNAPEWKPLPIGKKIDLLSGYPFDGTDISENPRGTRLLRGINITEGIIRHSQYIDRYFLGCVDKLEKYILQNNDLVIGMDGSKVGKNSALITPSDSGALLVQRVARLRADSTTPINFIYHHINSRKFHAYVDRINTSSGIPHISAKQINDFQICFPCVDEQQKIAACLSSLDELIAAQTQKLAALKAHKKGLMQQLFPAADEVTG